MKSFELKEGNAWYHVKVDLETEIEKDKWGVARADSPAHYLLVNEVFRPEIELDSKVASPLMHLWRFHRQFRSFDEGMRLEPVEGAIHQFKFKFYTSERGFKLVEGSIVPKLKALYKQKLILKWEAKKSPDSGEFIGSDRDISWSYEIKRVWPYFIHGVSLSWYLLIKGVVEDRAKETFKDRNWLDGPLGDRLELYGGVRRDVLDLWEKYANGAFFHQMNALFGYHKVWSLIWP